MLVDDLDDDSVEK
jgi:hypothetical protein